ncbi:MAG: ATP-binding protein [Pseudomonadota bacterium]
MKLRTLIQWLLLGIGLAPLLVAVALNLPLVLNRVEWFYHKAHLQNLRADFRDLDQHLASRHEMIRLLAKLPEPGALLGEGKSVKTIDFARARFTEWINQILVDQRDIIQILFLGLDGRERFWLERDMTTAEWRPTPGLPDRPSSEFLSHVQSLEPGGVLINRIRLDPQGGLQDPRRLMVLHLMSPVMQTQRPVVMGAVLMTLDVGGMAQFYRNTYWVNHNGSYLLPGRTLSEERKAFRDFPGLAEIFAEEKLDLWRGSEGDEVIWVPMFLTEGSGPLWVGRRVDTSPMASLREALVIRSLSIVAGLILMVIVVARWIALRLERFGQDLLAGIRQVLKGGQEVAFAWGGPQEVRALGEELTALIHSHVAHTRALAEHAREIEDSSRYKSEFLTNVSHELRTPLNSILLLSKVLADPSSGLADEARQQARVIHEAGSDLRGLIENILDLSRIEAHQMTFSLDQVDIRLLLEGLCELMRPQFENKQLYLTVVMQPDAPSGLFTDAEKLRQILKNFLSNAVKFTQTGGVSIHVERTLDAQRPLAIRVSDTGVGIPKDKQQSIFEAFQQADGSTRRRFGGTGLGLTISRELSTLLGGLIEVQSQEGQGACFALTLPLDFDYSQVEEEHLELLEPLAPRTALKPEVEWVTKKPLPTVLVVAGEVQDLLTLTPLLEKEGFRVAGAGDLEEAADTLAEEEIGLVILDAGLAPPVECDTIRRICSRAGGGEGKVPLWLLVNDSEGLSVGIGDCVTGSLRRPVGEEDLRAILSSLRIVSLRADTGEIA